MSFIIFVSRLKCFSVRVRLSVSDIWSSFWITMHAYWVLMPAKQSIVYWGLTYLQTLIKVTFVANIGFIRSILLTLFERFYLWPRMAFKCIGNFRLSPWIFYHTDYFSYLPGFDMTITLLWSTAISFCAAVSSFQPLPLCSSPPPAPPA